VVARRRREKRSRPGGSPPNTLSFIWWPERSRIQGHSVPVSARGYFHRASQWSSHLFHPRPRHTAVPTSWKIMVYLFFATCLFDLAEVLTRFKKKVFPALFPVDFRSFPSFSHAIFHFTAFCYYRTISSISLIYNTSLKIKYDNCILLDHKGLLAAFNQRRNFMEKVKTNQKRIMVYKYI
jgi:hypothetical protein